MSDDARRDLVVVEVPSARDGLSLIDHLPRLHAELSPIDDERCTVRVELADQTFEVLRDTLERVRRWQSCVGVHALRARVGTHVYTLVAS